MSLDEPARGGDPEIARRRQLTDALSDVDDAVDAERRRVRELPGLPLPGRPDDVAPPPVPGFDPGPSVDAVRRLRELQQRRDGLARERRAHALRRRTLEECERSALEWLNQVGSADELLAQIVPDPAVRRPPFPQATPEARRKVANAILRFRAMQPGGTIQQLDHLRAVPRVDEPLVRHLLHTGCVRTEAARDEGVQATIGVLLPVRIETRFYPGRLRVRVVPDEPWFARHDPRVSEGEVAAVRRYVAAAADAADEAARRQAWHELVGHVGGARAVFLVRSLIVTGPAGDPVVRRLRSAERRKEPAFPRIEGFPAELRVWLARGDAAPVEVAVLSVDRDRIGADFADPEVPGDRRWWEDWDEAVAVGLAVEVPLEGDPGDIEALYVTGLGDGDPATLFAQHRDEGRLGLVAPGTPTNSVDGAPAAPLGDDPDTWWEVLQSPASQTDRLVSRALTGDPALLGNLPGASEPHRELAASLVSGLWPALWGFPGQDVWAVPDGTNEASAWASEALFPEGPFPTLRVGSQPYGLLPATALLRWARAEGDPKVEEGWPKALVQLRQRYRDAAVARGTVAGASPSELLDLLGHVPTSPLYRHRRAWPLELWLLAFLLLGFGGSWQEFDRAWREQYGIASSVGLNPARRYASLAAARRVDLPLVVPPELPDGQRVGDLLRELVELALKSPTVFAGPFPRLREALSVPPDSLLLRLAIRSLQMAIGDVGRENASEEPPGPEPVVRLARDPGRLEAWIRRVEAADLTAATPAAERFRRAADGLMNVATIDDDGRLERLLRAVLDTATHRIDPWLVGLPTRRLDDLLDDPNAKQLLGVYGWVDRPRPGTPGPTAGGLLHAPSPGQTLAATVLRDRAVNEAGSPRWDLDLTSRSVRDADRIAEHVRVGAHLSEALGREVERAVADPDDVARLRRTFPARTEHEGRRVCDGQKVLAAAPATLGLDPSQLAGLDRLRAALDAYGDLLVADAVHHVTQGRAEVAGAVMDAAAGFARPPHLGLLRTPREGRAVATSVVVLLRDVAEPPVPVSSLERAELSPGALADAAAAAFVRDQTGDGTDWEFEVAEVDDTGAAVGTPVTVTLADLGIDPVDALALPLTDLERLVTDEAVAPLGVDPEEAALGVVAGSGPDLYEQAARLVAVLGRTPAGADALTEQADAVVDATPVDADLQHRYARVRATLDQLVTLLTDELSVAAPDGGLGGADRATLERLVAACRAWGVAPDPPAEPPETADRADRRLVAMAFRALELLTARRDDTPGSVAAAALGRDDLVAALARAVTPTGQLAVTSRLARTLVPALRPPAPAPSPDLDAEWLPVVAAVRPPLAGVEVHQLSAGTPQGSGPAFVPWTNKRDDPWQRNDSDARRMVVAYVAATVDLSALPGSARLAAAAVDRFTEVVPAEEQTTGVAFGFDGPASRAPQAILLAVPPNLDVPLDDRNVLDVVADTRELLRARMARPVDLDRALRALLPASLVPAAGSTAVPLDGGGA